MSDRWTIYRCALAVLAITTAMAASLVDGQTAGIGGYLVLRNGNVLEGAIRRHGDNYRVDLGEASLQVPADQVEMFCQTLDEAYERRRRDRVGASVDAHLELARWCIRHNLLEQASREALDVRTTDPDHPGLRTLETQLGQMLQLRSLREATTRATATPPIELEPAESQAPVEIVKRFDVPAEAQAQFVRSIQPMLVRSCATAGCHQPQSPQKLQLDRWALEGGGNPNLIRRNLASVVGQVDGDDPGRSPLVEWARQSHGARAGKASKPLAPHQAELLLKWMNVAAGVIPTEAAPLTADGTVDELFADSSDGQTANASEGEATPVERPPADSKFVPRDEFDAEIFNRRSYRPATIQRSATPAPSVNESEAIAPATTASAAAADPIIPEEPPPAVE